MADRPFAGADKVNPSLLGPLERRFAPWMLPRLPAWVETYHLTMLTPAWCAGWLVCCAAGVGDRRWLWGASLMVVLQWFTDHLDGKLGKLRDTGLERGGFYVDHMFDAFFISSVLIGYCWLLPEHAMRDLLLLFAVCAGFMVHAVLAFSATETFRISYLRIGPTELRLGIVLLNVVLIREGFEGMARGLPYAAAVGFVVLVLRVHATHARLWRLERRREDTQDAIR
jgi:archaetidylinositol phosphate synthase